MRDYSPPTPSPSLTLLPSDMHKPPFVDFVARDRIIGQYRENNQGGGGFFGRKGKKVVEKEEKELESRFTVGETDDGVKPLMSCIHPSMTLLGTQCSVIVGLKNGQIVKWNDIPRNGGRLAAYGKTVAMAEPGNPNNPSAQEFNAVPSPAQREFFEFHKTEILGIFFESNARLDMVSVDKDGYVAKWKYDKGNFTGHGWFKPSETIHLKLDAESKSSIQSVCQSASGSEIFILVESSSKNLVLYCLHIASMKLVANKVTAASVSSPHSLPAHCSAFPVVSSLGSDYVVVTQGGSVKMYGIVSGNEVMKGELGRGVGRAVKSAEVDRLGQCLVYDDPDAAGIQLDLLNFEEWESDEGKQLRERLSKEGRGSRDCTSDVSMTIGRSEEPWSRDATYFRWSMAREIVIQCGEAAAGSGKISQEEAKVERGEKSNADDKSFLDGLVLGTVQPTKILDLRRDNDS